MGVDGVIDSVQAIRAMVAEGRFLAAKRLVQGVLNSPDTPVHEKAQVALLGSQAAMSTRDAYLAWTFAQKALGLAQECESEEIEGRSLFAISAARLAIGDYAETRIFLRQFVDGLADRWPQLEEELSARAYGNLGLALAGQKLFPDALAAFTSCLTRLQTAGNHQGQVMAHHQMSWVLMQMGAYDEAREHLEQASALGPLPKQLIPHHQSHQALYYLYSEEFGKAMEQAVELLDVSREDVSTSTKAVACFVAGKCALKQGNLQMAKWFANHSVEFATQDGLSSLLNLVSCLRREVLAATSVPDPKGAE